MNRYIVFLILFVIYTSASAQLRFALVTDTHIGGTGADEDLRRTVTDINGIDTIDFVIVSGDVTEFGSDAELTLVKEILEGLNKPWYIVPGNHDTKWSESGANSFRRIFGAETFCFTHGGYLIIGTNSGPNMRMGPGQIPRENIVWLDSVLSLPQYKELKIISVNHYPLDNGLNNWYELTGRLKSRDIRLALCGHGHSNRVMNFEGIPALMGRSNLRARDTVGGYNIMRISGDTLLTASVRHPLVTAMPPWVSLRLSAYDAGSDTIAYPRPDYSMNSLYAAVKETWRVQEKSDIGAGAATSRRVVIVTNTGGEVKALDLKNGKTRWIHATGAKIYSTPATDGKKVITAATDGMVYALNIRNGEVLWSFNTRQPVVASPTITGDRVFIAGSSGKCFALSLDSGKVLWSNSLIEGFVETIPLVYRGKIIFGTWSNHLYALDAETGDIAWEWYNGYTNRMLSPAACVPVAAGERVFVVAPDRKMACLDVSNGTLLWHSDLGEQTVRESMGLSTDSSLVYAKTMDGNLIGVKADGSEDKVSWKADVNTGYDIAPAVIAESNGIVFIPTDKGIIYAVSRDNGKLLWIHRISSCLINQVTPAGPGRVVCTSMDGVVTMLSFRR
ncbi:MAG: PQQ-binding-like beta-propeller repeat protein [Bacteroidales bacterium]|nr:PQQ-binding-like beta-propeller repeat protein [Bacteroidales bacterium]